MYNLKIINNFCVTSHELLKFFSHLSLFAIIVACKSLTFCINFSVFIYLYLGHSCVAILSNVIRSAHAFAISEY